MKTSLPLPLTISGQRAFIANLRLLLLGVLIFVANYVFATSNPSVSIKNRLGDKAKYLPAVPTISYASPQTYSVGFPIAPLAPTSTGVASPGYGSPVPIASGLTLPSDLVVDAAGNVYVVDNGNLKKIPAGGGVPVTMAVAKDVAIDAAGNLYVIDGQKIKKIPAGGGATVTLSPTFVRPSALAVDAAGNVYVSDPGGSTVQKIPVGGGGPVTIGDQFFVDPIDIAVDAAGNAYVSEFNFAYIVKVSASDNSEVIAASGFRPYAVALDATGNIYLADADHASVSKVTTFQGPAVSFASIGNCHGITVDASGVVYVSDQQTKQVYKITPTGGYYLNKPLPAGLSFSASTGVIAGTPTAVTPASNYTIVGYNASGGKSAIVNITTKLPPLPAISYTTPTVFGTGVPVASFKPTSSNIAALNYGNNATNFATGLNVAGMVTDVAGNLYVADKNSKLIKKIPAGGGPPTTIGPKFNHIAGVALDSTGHLYVADSNQVKRMTIAGGSLVTLSSKFLPIKGIITDSKGNVYVIDSDFDFDQVEKLSVGSNTPISIFGTSFIVGIALDTQNNLYVTTGNEIIKVPASGGDEVDIPHGSGGIVTDAIGNIYIESENGDSNEIIPADGSSPLPINSNLFSRIMAVDRVGNLYSFISNAVKKTRPVGGYFINRPLPAGLSFSNVTGIINGTPTNASPATNYIITAYNVSGGSSTMTNITVNSVLTISYVTPQTYFTGTAITPLVPTSTSVASAGYSNSQVNLGSGFNAPNGVAIDAAGNIYVADQGNDKIKKISVGGGAPIPIGSGFSQPGGVAVDAAGNVYVADSQNDDIKKIPAGGGNPVTLYHYPDDILPSSIAVDFSGQFLYITNIDDFDGGVDKLSVNGGSPLPIGSGFVGPTSVAVDGLGNVFVIDRDTNNFPIVKKIPFTGGPVVRIGSAISNPNAVTVDESGNIFIISNGTTIKKISSTGGAPFTVTTVPGFASSISLDGAGNIYITDNDNVKKIKPTGGYYLSRPLPQGLHFSNTTGVFSGTPVATIPATNYTVTAYNGSGSKSATVNIKVNLSPVPSINYTSSKTYVTNTAISPLVPVSSGVDPAGYNPTPANFASGFITLSGITADVAGNVYVTDKDNDKIKKFPATGGPATLLGSGLLGLYDVSVDALGNVYAVGSNDDVIKIPVGGGNQITLHHYDSDIAPESVVADGSGHLYVGTVDDFDGSVDKLSVNPGGAMEFGPAGFVDPQSLALDGVGNLYIVDFVQNAIYKTPANGGPTFPVNTGINNPYALAIDASNNMYVVSFDNTVKKVSAGGGSPTTISSAFVYAADVAVDGAGNIFVADDNDNTVKKIKPVGGYYLNRPLPVGLNFSNSTGIISGTPTSPSPATDYIITAYNSFGGKSDTVNITVLSSNTNLASLKLSSGTLTPVFSPSHLSYTASVNNTTASIQVTPTSSSLFATIKVNGVAVTSGTASQSIPLVVGSNSITTVVTAQSGVIKTYTVNITRAASSVAATENVLATIDGAADDGVFVHQALSPNGDGTNDVLVIDKINSYPDNELVIINASGVKVFDIRGYDNTSKVFDGHSNITGAMQQPGTYFYSVDYTINGTHKHKTGYIIIKY